MQNTNGLFKFKTATMPDIQIIATIGPSSKDKEVIRKMVQAGMSCARLNFSWGTHEEHGHFADMVREVAQSEGKSVPLIQDLSGPRVQKEEGHTYNAALPSITEKDIADLAFTEEKKPEYIALSFVRDADDIRTLRGLLKERSLQCRVIAKIERVEALQELDAIIEEADGIMVARGDLGDAIPYETLPFVKKDILKKCMIAGKPAVVATEMLTSMTEDSDPSRADITDIAQAVLDGASATMLSDETATGQFPVEAVSVMRRVVNEALTHASLQSPVRF